MSSYYSAICLSHNPPIVDGINYISVEALLADAPHPHCDLLIGKWSGGLVELICPPNGDREHYTHPAHSYTRTIDAAWLRLLFELADKSPAHKDSILRLPACWRPVRTAKLADLLE